jgi:hypothetical protein
VNLEEENYNRRATRSDSAEAIEMLRGSWFFAQIRKSRICPDERTRKAGKQSDGGQLLFVRRFVRADTPDR